MQNNRLSLNLQLSGQTSNFVQYGAKMRLAYASGG